MQNGLFMFEGHHVFLFSDRLAKHLIRYIVLRWKADVGPIVSNDFSVFCQKEDGIRVIVICLRPRGIRRDDGVGADLCTDGNSAK